MSAWLGTHVYATRQIIVSCQWSQKPKRIAFYLNTPTLYITSTYNLTQMERKREMSNRLLSETVLDQSPFMSFYTIQYRTEAY